MPESVPYRLSISPELEVFRPELEYACNFIDRCHFTLRTDDARIVLHYGPNPPEGAMANPAVLFPGGVRLDGNGIHPVPAFIDQQIKSTGTGGLFPKQGMDRTAATLPYDALGTIFFMLSRLEERGAPATDQYGRFPYEASAISRRRMNSELPPADRAAADLSRLLTGAEKPEIRSIFEVMLTHDVDRLRGYHRPLGPLRTIAGDLVKRRAPVSAFHRARNAWFSGEPWRSFNELMDMSEEYGFKSRFYFMGPSLSPMDSPYAITMPRLLRKVTDSIQERGHIVGFHPGYDTMATPSEWHQQHKALEEIVGTPICEGRQHVLRYDAAITPDIWNDAGMSLDSTLAFPEMTTFRAGTCRRFQSYSLRCRQSLQLEQVSTAIMDFSLFGGKYRDLLPDEALEDCRMAIRTCRLLGGTLVVLFHTGQTRAPMRVIYERLLQALH